LEFLERPQAAHHEIPNDQQRPAIAQKFERDADWTSGTGLGFWLSCHCGNTVPSSLANCKLVKWPQESRLTCNEAARHPH
jgi:hypothetical protein